MKQVLIHIGLHKTGTSWLQRELFVTESDVFYPLILSSKRKRGHSTLARDFFFSENGYLLNSHDSNSEIINESLNAILKEAKNLDKTFVMSHERLSGDPQSSGFDSSIIADRIKNIFPNGKILIMIREQTSWIFSSYFQYLHEGGTLSLSKYLSMKYDGRRPGFSPNYLNYHHLIGSYQNKFGKTNVLVIPYELFCLDKDLFFKELNQFLSVKITLEKEKFNKKHNFRSNYFINYKFRFLNNFIKSSSSLNGSSGMNYKTIKATLLKIKLLATWITPKKMDLYISDQLTKEIKEWSNQKFIQSNKITSDLIGKNLADYGYMTPNKDLN